MLTWMERHQLEQEQGPLACSLVLKELHFDDLFDHNVIYAYS